LAFLHPLRTKHPQFDNARFAEKVAFLGSGRTLLNRRDAMRRIEGAIP
jgi:hypothetical protein